MIRAEPDPAAHAASTPTSIERLAESIADAGVDPAAHRARPSATGATS